MSDRLTLDAPRRDSAGNMVASVLAARTGLQDYAGYEVGKPDQARVVVYRPAEEVFSRDSMRSFAGAPVTIEHPSEPVNPSNWKDHAVGEASEEIVRDGEAVRVPFLLRDSAGIQAVEAGKREISMGYECTLDWTPGQTADGTPYDAVQRGIRINHLAIVDRARGGPTLRIGDQEKTTMKIKIGDAEVEVTDGAAVAVAVGTLNAKLSDAETKVGTLTGENATLKTTVEAKDGEIVALNAKLTDANDPIKIAARDAARRNVVDKARVLVPTLVTDGKDDAAIRKEAVTAKLGDAAKDMSDAAVEGAFLALTKDAKVQDSTVHPIIAPTIVGDAATEYVTARNKQRRDLSDAWRTPFNPAEAA
jgi:hypothetical protein